MRRLVHAALGVAMLAILALVALAVLLPKWLASDPVRARIAEASQVALGRELRYGWLELGWSPPAVVMAAPVIAGATSDALPFAQAPRAVWRVSSASLLTLEPWIDQVVITDATLRFEDDAVDPAVVWELRELAATLSRDSPEARVRVEASFGLAGGGHAVARGSAAGARDVDLVMTLEDVSLARVAAYLDAGARLAGAVSGTLELAGPAQSPVRVSARLALSDGDVQLGEVALRGPLRVELELAGGRGARSGRFAVDATDAEIAVGRSYRKAPGTSATVAGRIIPGKGGRLAVDDVKLRVGDPGASRSG